jgi:hypothetical protein
MLYIVADIFFVIFHTGLILFNLLGWIWKPLRPWNLAALLLTGASWFILGIFYGIGYCPFTDWHFTILDELGKHPGTNSYIDYILERILGLSVEASMVDNWTVTMYFVVLSVSIFFNFFKK